jgi:hypothetical protein
LEPNGGIPNVAADVFVGVTSFGAAEFLEAAWTVEPNIPIEFVAGCVDADAPNPNPVVAGGAPVSAADVDGAFLAGSDDRELEPPNENGCAVAAAGAAATVLAAPPKEKFGVLEGTGTEPVGSVPNIPEDVAPPGSGADFVKSFGNPNVGMGGSAFWLAAVGAAWGGAAPPNENGAVAGAADPATELLLAAPPHENPAVGFVEAGSFDTSGFKPPKSSAGIVGIFTGALAGADTGAGGAGGAGAGADPKLKLGPADELEDEVNEIPPDPIDDAPAEEPADDGPANANPSLVTEAGAPTLPKLKGVAPEFAAGTCPSPLKLNLILLLSFLSDFSVPTFFLPSVSVNVGGRTNPVPTKAMPSLEGVAPPSLFGTATGDGCLLGEQGGLPETEGLCVCCAKDAGNWRLKPVDAGPAAGDAACLLDSSVLSASGGISLVGRGLMFTATDDDDDELVGEAAAGLPMSPKLNAKPGFEVAAEAPLVSVLKSMPAVCDVGDGLGLLGVGGADARSAALRMLLIFSMMSAVCFSSITGSSNGIPLYSALSNAVNVVINRILEFLEDDSVCSWRFFDSNDSTVSVSSSGAS